METPAEGMLAPEPPRPVAPKHERASGSGRVPHAPPHSGLAWCERRGLIDAALVVVAVVQTLTFHPYFTRKGYFQDYQLAPQMTVVILISALLTWLLLGLGALAPLSRRSAARAGRWPVESVLWLAAYGLMAVCWLLVIFNLDPMRLWGFWHLAVFPPWVAAQWVALLPLAWAPLWRRLARGLRLAWLRRRRPGRPGRDARLFRHGRALLPWLALTAYAWLLSDRFVTSDGWGLIGFAQTSTPLQPSGYREPGFLLLHRLIAHTLRPVGLNAMQSIALVNFGATLTTLVLLGWFLRILRLSPAQRRVGWWLALSSLGVTQMLLGHLELYPLVQLALAATMVLGVASLQADLSPAWFALAFAFGLAGHLSLIFILPGVLLLVWFWSRGPNAPGRPRRTLARGLAHLLGWGALVHLPLWACLMERLDPATPLALLRAVTGSLNTGASREPFVFERGAPLVQKLTQLFDPLNDFKMIQLLFLVAGGALLIALLIPLARLLRAWPAARRPDPAASRQLLVLLAAWLGYGVYAFAWRAQWDWIEDWDLFSGMAVLGVLCVIRWLMPAPQVWRLPPALVRHVCLFAFTLSLTQHVYYHRNASWLNASGKISFDPTIGPLIQNYQVQHGWMRGFDYSVVNGQVVLHEIGVGTTPGGNGPPSPPSAPRRTP